MLILNLSNQLRRFPAAPHFCSTRRCPIAAVGPAAPFVRLQWLRLQPLWLWLWLCELGHCVSLSWVTELVNGWVLIWLLDWQTPVVPEVRFNYQVKRRLSSFVFWVGSWGTRKSQDLKQGCSWVVLGVFCCSPFVSNGTEICERIMKWHVTRAVARAFASVRVESPVASPKQIDSSRQQPPCSPWCPQQRHPHKAGIKTVLLGIARLWIGQSLTWQRYYRWRNLKQLD